MPDGTDDHTSITERRRCHGLTRCPHDGLTKGKMDKRMQHENEPLQNLPAKILPPLTK